MLFAPALLSRSYYLQRCMEISRNRITPLGIGLLAVALAAAAAVYWQAARLERVQATQESTLERIRRTGVVRIGYANEAPFGYLNTETGRITGEAPEIARVMLRKLGAKRVEPVVTEFGSLIPGLKAGRFDVIAAGMYVTPPRCEEIAFSDPTYRVGEAFIVRRGNPLRLHSYTDVAEHPTAVLGFVGGTVEAGYADAAGIPAERIRLFPDNISALTAVRTGRIDASAATELTVRNLLDKANSPALEQAEPFTDPVIEGETVYGYGAFGFRQRDAELRRAFNQHLQEFVGSEEHLQLVGRFGITPDLLPQGKTAAQLCAGE